MALTDEVQSRVPSQQLIELTNPRDTTASAIDSTVLAQAASSIEAYFGRDAEESYDSTVAIHVEVCVNGVIALLRLWADGLYEGTQDFWDSFRAECGRVRAVRSRARIEPSTTSLTNHSTDTRTTIRPEFDDEQFADSTLNDPRDGGNATNQD